MEDAVNGLHSKYNYVKKSLYAVGDLFIFNPDRFNINPNPVLITISVLYFQEHRSY